MIRRLPFVLCAVIAMPTTLRGQLPAQRAAIWQLRDSLSQTTDSTSLRTLERATIDSARQHRDDAMIHLRLGFIAWRLAEMDHALVHLRDAEGEFEWATELQPSWPIGWYGLGNTELLEADEGLAATRAIIAVLGRDIYVDPARDLAHSAEVDSTFGRGVTEFAAEALRQDIPAHLNAALLALREVGGAAAARNPAILLARGRVEREVGDVDSALAAFRQLVHERPNDAVALLELARTEMATGNLAGADLWYEGLALADSEALALYRFDLSLVMSDSALAAFDAAPPAQRVAVARRFWDTRDPNSLNSSAERLREHYRRIRIASREFPMHPRGHRYDSVATFVPTDSRFDDRGRIYVRHGEPDVRTSLPLTTLPPNETWVYHRPGGDLIFNFAEPDSAQGYRIYESLLDIAGLGGPAQHTGQGDVSARLASGTALETYGAGWTAQTVEALLQSREAISPLYRRLLTASPATVAAIEQTERTVGRKDMQIGLQTDSWEFGYELPLTADVEVAAVGDDAHGPEVQVGFAIAGSSLYAPPGNGTYIYPVRIRVALRDAHGDLVASSDTQRYFAMDHPIGIDDHLLGRVALPAPAGDYTAHVAIESGVRGVVPSPEPVHVVGAGRGITLSDLALGAHNVPLAWQPDPGDTAWINPSGHFRNSQPMQLYFEVGGVPHGESYHVEMAVLRPGHTGPDLQFSFNDVSAGEPTRVRRELDIGHLRGDYVMQITVSTPSGKAVRRRAFTVDR